MPLTKKDLDLMKNLIADQFIQERQHLRTVLDQQSQDIKRDIHDEMDAKFNARFGAFRKEMQQEFAAVRKEIRDNSFFLAEIISDCIFPDIDRLDKDVLKIRAFVGMGAT